MPEATAVTIIAALGGLSGVAAIITTIITARGTATKTRVDALALTIQTLQDENTRLVKRLGEMEAENVELRSRQTVLEGQIDTLQCEVERLRDENRRLRQGRTK